MDWSFLEYLIFLAKEGWLSLLLLAATTPALISAGLPNRKLIAGAPGIVAILVFVLSCYIASLSNTDASIPFAGFLLTALLVIPSVLALRHRWLGLLHIITLLAALYLGVISSLAISGDGP